METHYERLSFLDSTFLALEGPSNPMHVGATLIFEAGPLISAAGGVDAERIRDFFDVRLQYIPRYRQRLEWIPIERHPVWVDDEHFDIRYHIRHIALPHPGTEAELQSFVGRVFSERLDRSKPLWEMWVVEGLEGGRMALVTKIHHCMIDGMAGVDLLKVALSPFPDPTIGTMEEYEPRPVPEPFELLMDEMVRRLKAPKEALSSVRGFLDESKEASEEIQARLKAMFTSARSGWFSNASLTPINDHIGPNRRFTWFTSELDEVKVVKNQYGGTVNDVVIAAVAGGIRSYLHQDRGVDVCELDFRAMVPVSIRGDLPTAELGNQVTMWLVDLPLDTADPIEQLEAVSATTSHLKESDQALGAASLTQSVAWTPGTLLSAGARLAASTARPFNMTITNVPGPQIPLYLMEAKMVANYPMVPLWVNHGVGVALFSYDGRLNWGIVADWDLVPDIDVVMRRIEEAMAALTSKARARELRRAAARKAAATRKANASRGTGDAPE
ncbi:wax ester/triacylglycerol synthase family O-acyltransferase [bacterium]|nr:wax ester/triacylglycerol synthase family O-acyltransferase [bacterium]